WGQIGYSATTNVPQPSAVPTVDMSNPFPSGLVQPSGNSLGLLSGAGGDVFFIDPNKGAPRVQQYSTDLQRELGRGVPLSVGCTGETWVGADRAIRRSISISWIRNIRRSSRTHSSSCRIRSSASPRRVSSRPAAR